ARWVGLKRLADQGIGSDRAVVAPVVRGGVDVVHAELDGSAEHGAAGVGIPGRTVPCRGGQAHRAEAEAADREVAAQKELVLHRSLRPCPLDMEGPPVQIQISGGTSGCKRRSEFGATPSRTGTISSLPPCARSPRTRTPRSKASRATRAWGSGRSTGTTPRARRSWKPRIERRSRSSAISRP